MVEHTVQHWHFVRTKVTETLEPIHGSLWSEIVLSSTASDHFRRTPTCLLGFCICLLSQRMQKRHKAAHFTAQHRSCSCIRPAHAGDYAGKRWPTPLGTSRLLALWFECASMNAWPGNSPQDWRLITRLVAERYLNKRNARIALTGDWHTGMSCDAQRRTVTSYTHEESRIQFQCGLRVPISTPAHHSERVMMSSADKDIKWLRQFATTGNSAQRRTAAPAHLPLVISIGPWL